MSKVISTLTIIRNTGAITGVAAVASILIYLALGLIGTFGTVFLNTMFVTAFITLVVGFAAMVRLDALNE